MGWLRGLWRTPFRQSRSPACSWLKYYYTEADNSDWMTQNEDKQQDDDEDEEELFYTYD